MKTATRLLTCSAAASLLLLAATVGADPIYDTGIFELDGNAVNAPAVPGDDWDQIYCADPDTPQAEKDQHCSVVAAPSGDLMLSQFITDGYNDPAADYGFEPSNKDIDATVILEVRNINDKSDIEHAYAALYRKTTAEGPEVYLHFGLDLLATNGDAAIGFWFTQNSKATVIGGEWQRKPGDVLVQADLLNGGTNAHVDVYTWGTNDGLNEQVGNSNLYLFMHGALCNLLQGDEYACAITDDGGETAPWDYAYKDSGGEHESTTFALNAFFEGGVELSKLFGGKLPCLSTFIAETRQSQSEDATLVDAAVGELEVCSIGVKKEAQDLSKVGDTVNYTVTIENTGIVRLYKQSISDSLYGDLAGQCGTYLDAGQKCTITYSRIVASGDPDPLTNKVTAVYDDAATLNGAEVTDTYTWDVNLFQPAIDLAKSGTPTPVKEYANVSYTLKLDNTSSTDTPKLVDCHIQDVLLGVNEGAFELTTKGSSKTVGKSYAWMSVETNPNCVASGDNYRCTNTASASCDVDGFPNTLNDTASFTVTVIPAKPVFRVVKTGDGYSKVGDTIAYRVTVYNDSPYFPLKINSVADTRAGTLTAAFIAKCGDTLALADGNDASGADQCSYDYTYTVPASPVPTDPLSNKVTVTGQVVGGTTATRDSTWSVDLLKPSVDIAKSCRPSTPVEPGSWVSFEIDTTNTGDADLLVNISDTKLGINQTNLSLPKKPGTCEYGNASDAADGCYRIEASLQITSDVTNTARVTAYLDPKYGDLKLGGMPNKYEDSASSTCTVRKVGSATRTWGFWKTHGSDGDRFSSPYPIYGYTGYIAEQMLPIDLGWIDLTSIEDVFGLFWEKKAHCDKLTMTRLQASYQFLAAMMNDYAFNTDIPNACAKGPYSGKTNAELFATMRTVLAGTNQKAMRDLMTVFSCYNEAGDDYAIVDEVPVPPADPNGTRGIAHDVVTTCQ